MSKRTNGHKPPEPITTYHGRREQSFVTSLGVTLSVGPMPIGLPDVVRAIVKSEWEESGRPLPTVPTYETENVVGDKQKHEHDETTLDTDEEKAEWLAYKKLETEFNHAVSQRIFEEMARQCVRFDIPTGFREKNKRLRPPEDDEELRWWYLKMAALGSREDVQNILTISTRLTGMEAQRVSAVEESFPDSVEETDTAEPVKPEAGRVGT